MIMTVFYVGTCNNGQRQHDYTCCMFKYNPNWEYRYCYHFNGICKLKFFQNIPFSVDECLLHSFWDCDHGKRLWGGPQTGPGILCWVCPHWWARPQPLPSICLQFVYFQITLDFLSTLNSCSQCNILQIWINNRREMIIRN